MAIAATLIVRNEARCIARCLESARPWVDRIVVVDTGSTDGTPEIARAAGAEVHRLDWPDDFSIARNHALALADADWHLVLDADEVVEQGGELLRAWCAGPPRLGQVCIHSQFDAAGNPADRPVSTSRSWITRVLPRGARFAGRVHEQVESALPRERIELHLGHDGYRDAQMAAKRERNRTLLLRELADRPDDIYLFYQLGTEAEGRDEFAAACDWYGKAFAAIPAHEPWRHDLTVRYLHSLGRAGQLNEALELAERCQQEFLNSPDFFFVVGNLALDCALADPAEAIPHWLPLAVSSWEQCLAIGERPDLEGSVEGRGSHLAQHNLDAVSQQLAGLRQ
jgi:glycosyltransferase involved in cell wall biosynthesis